MCDQCSTPVALPYLSWIGIQCMLRQHAKRTPVGAHHAAEIQHTARYQFLITSQLAHRFTTPSAALTAYDDVKIEMRRGDWTTLIRLLAESRILPERHAACVLHNAYRRAVLDQGSEYSNSMNPQHGSHTPIRRRAYRKV
jgi:hypothetical protein